MDKMSDRRGYEADDLRKAAKAVERKGGKKAYEHDMRLERKDYHSDEAHFKAHRQAKNAKLRGSRKEGRSGNDAYHGKMSW